MKCTVCATLFISIFVILPCGYIFTLLPFNIFTLEGKYDIHSCFKKN